MLLRRSLSNGTALNIHVTVQASKMLRINVCICVLLFQVKNTIVSEEFIKWDSAIYDVYHAAGRIRQPAPDAEGWESYSDFRFTLHYCHYRSSLFL